MILFCGSYKDQPGQYLGSLYEHATTKPLLVPYTIMGWMKDNQVPINHFAVFVDYTGSNLEIHLHMPNLITKQMIKEVYTYVFKQLKCSRLTAKPYSTNEKLLRLLPRLGFCYECTLENFYGEPGAPVDALVYKLTPDNASRWIN